jgi:acetyl-CoA carboxylase biotin carboxyl carrier protein
MSVQPDQIDRIVGWLMHTDIDLVEFSNQVQAVRLTRAADGGILKTALAPPSCNGRLKLCATEKDVIRANGVGRFLTRHPLQESPLVRPGDAVWPGQTIGLLQVGALLVPVHAPAHGLVAGFLAADGALVGYGAPLVQLVHP